MSSQPRNKREWEETEKAINPQKPTSVFFLYKTSFSSISNFFFNLLYFN